MQLIKVFLVYSLISINSGDQFDTFWKHYLSPTVFSGYSNCSISACDALRIIAQMFIIGNGLKNDDGSLKRTNFQLPDIKSVTMESDLQKQIRQIESRLRSVEQPVWRLTPASRTEWNHCTSGICRCNPDTKTFTCWSANLKSVPASQVIPMNMVFIDLSRNALSTLHKDTFRGLTLLQELDLSNNFLDFIPYDLFQDLDSLMQLRIQSNQIEDLDQRTFWKLRNLNLLDMSKNILSDVPENLFNHVQRLSVINLSVNRINNFPSEMLRDQYVLEELDISKNEISILKSGSLKNLEHLKILDFSSNMIANISDDFFHGARNLKTLIMHSNRLTSVTRKMFEYLTQLLTLDLTMNRISWIDSKAFAELVNLQELFLGQNSLSNIPDGLFLNTLSLKRLTFFSNNLTTLEQNDFKGLKNLKNLMLNNNILKGFNPKVFHPLINLEKLRIDSNKLQFLPHGSLDGLHKLIAVKLDKNPWHCDCRALYLARWIRESGPKLWDGRPMCRGPGDLGGHEVGLLRYDNLCDGQWASMMSLSPRLPVRKNRISTPMNYTDYFNLYLKHIYPSTTESQREQLSSTASSRYFSES